MWEKAISLWGPIGAVMLLLLGWQLLSVLHLVDSLLLAAPTEVFLWIYANINSQELLQDIGVTLARVLISFGIASAIGIPVGILLGYLPNLEKVLFFPIDFSRSIPATALFPLFLVFFGVGEGARAAAAVYGASLIILMSTLSGVKQVSKQRILAARLYGASGFKLLRHVYFPEALPSIMTGCRLGISITFVIITLVEMFIGTKVGLGHRIIDAQVLYEIPEMYGTIFIAGVLGYILNLVIVFIERKFVHYAQY